MTDRLNTENQPTMTPNITDPIVPDGIDVDLPETLPEDFFTRIESIRMNGWVNMLESSAVANICIQLDWDDMADWIGDRRTSMEYIRLLTEGPEHSMRLSSMDGRGELSIRLGRWPSHLGEDPHRTVHQLVLRG